MTTVRHFLGWTGEIAERGYGGWIRLVGNEGWSNGKHFEEIGSMANRTFSTREIALPKKKTSPRERLLDYVMLLYGTKKIGKTTLAAAFPDCCFLALEPGLRALSVYKVPTDNEIFVDWPHLRAYTSELVEDDRFHTLAVDIIDRAYELCMAHVCQLRGCEHPSEMEDYGATWGAVKKEFNDWVMELIGCGKGIVFISHDQERQIETALGEKVDRTLPTMAGQCQGVINGLCSTIAHYRYNGTRRELLIRGDETTIAGTQLEKNFQGITAIPMGNSPEEGYANIVAAFNNEPTWEVDDEGRPTYKKKKKKKKTKKKAKTKTSLTLKS